MLSDKVKLQTSVDSLYFPTQYFESKEATEVEIELREKFDAFKVWALTQVESI